MTHLYAVRFTQALPSQVMNRLCGLVAKERRERISRFYHWQDATRCLLAELLARYAVGLTLGCPMKSIAFGSTEYGKLFLPSAPDLHFNLSHSGAWVLCALSDRVVGADVEEIKEAFPELVAACFSVEEQRDINALNGEDRKSLFYALWTAKESYAKALGLGLGLDFRQYSMSPLSPEFPKIIAKGSQDASAAFWIGQMDDHHAAAVCEICDGESQPIVPVQIKFEVEDFIRQLF